MWGECHGKHAAPGKGDRTGRMLVSGHLLIVQAIEVLKQNIGLDPVREIFLYIYDFGKLVFGFFLSDQVACYLHLFFQRQLVNGLIDSPLTDNLGNCRGLYSSV